MNWKRIRTKSSLISLQWCALVWLIYRMMFNLFGAVFASFDNVYCHANLKRHFHIVWLFKERTELHSETALLWCSNINFSVLSESTVRFDLVPKSSIGINIGQFAPGRH